ncbi:MAG: phosphorylase [Proteobacteria bacterium]|nr:phosphorylase [Pseudomonadota bacterium]
MNRVGIVVALEGEGRSLTSRRLPEGKCLELENGALLALSHAGREAAARAASRLIDAGATALVSWGCAAALDPRLNPGDLLLPRQMLGAGGDTLAISPDWRDRIQKRLAPHLPVHDAPIAESVDIVSTAEAKAALFSATGAAALDMESAAVARVARERGVPVLIVRSIVDPAGLSVPPIIQSAFDADGKLHLFKLLTGLAMHPGNLPGLIRLGLHFRSAMETLRKVNTLLGQDLLHPEFTLAAAPEPAAHVR